MTQSLTTTNALIYKTVDGHMHCQCDACGEWKRFDGATSHYDTWRFRQGVLRNGNFTCTACYHARKEANRAKGIYEPSGQLNIGDKITMSTPVCATWVVCGLEGERVILEHESNRHRTSIDAAQLIDGIAAGAIGYGPVY